MATRSGKNNLVTPRVGAPSPRPMLYRCAGFASVWEWSDTPTKPEPAGVPFIRDVDCRLIVGAPVVIHVDIAFVTTCMNSKICDIGVITSRQVNLLLDSRLQISAKPDLEKIFDLFVGVQRQTSVLIDENAVISGWHSAQIDTDILVTGEFAEDFDAAIRVTEANQFEIAIDACLTMFGDAVLQTDEFIRVWRNHQRSADLQITAVRGIAVDMDGELQILAHSSFETVADIHVMVAEHFITTKDVAFVNDLSASVYVYLIRESHVIQV